VITHALLILGTRAWLKPGGLTKDAYGDFRNLKEDEMFVNDNFHYIVLEIKRFILPLPIFLLAERGQLNNLSP